MDRPRRLVPAGQRQRHRRHQPSLAPSSPPPTLVTARAHTLQLRQRDVIVVYATMPSPPWGNATTGCIAISSGAGTARAAAAFVPGLLQAHPLGPCAVAREGDQQGGGGARPAERSVPADGGLRARVRGDVPPRVPDAGPIHAVGDRAAARPLPRPRPGPRPHVQLRGHAGAARRRLPGHLRRAAALPLLQGRHLGRGPLPGLVLLGLAGGQHPSMGAAHEGDRQGERAAPLAGQGAVRVLEGQPSRVGSAPRPLPLQQRFRRRQRLERAAVRAGLGRRQPERLQGLQPGGAVPVQVQDLRAGAVVVGEREVHSRMRLADAGHRHALRGLLLPGARRRPPLLAHRPQGQVPRGQVRRRLGERASGAGPAHGQGGQRVREGGDEHGLRLRLHVARAHPVRCPAPVQAHRAGERRGALPRVHGLLRPRPGQGVHDGVQGDVCGRIRAMHVAAAVHRQGGEGDGCEGRGCEKKSS
uniref:Uncharacterized protein n=1 Tax=Triticum urartu TaxID=4572 RepID=A0A8R7R490_TRIUA